MSVLVSELMSSSTVTITDDASVERARELCLTHDVHFLVVIRDGECCGITCQCDLCWAWRGSCVADVMLHPVVAIQLKQTVRDAAQLMCEHGKGCLVVVDGAGRLSGVITRRDLLDSGFLEGERGIDCCATCGDAQHLLPVDCPGAPAFCGDCLEQVRHSSATEPYFRSAGGSAG